MYGPNTLFDKSFLQSLSVDESVWFDNFFRANICPLFYAETLADLEKEDIRKGRTPEQEVRIIADKFPEMHGTPNAHHMHLAPASLMGPHPPMMTGQIVLPRGTLVSTETSPVFVMEPSPEADAFVRWQRGEFREIDRRYARAWRKELSLLDLNKTAEALRSMGISRQSCKSLEEAKIFAEALFQSPDYARQSIMMAVLFLKIPQVLHEQVLHNWSTSGSRPLIDYAPYAAHVLTVQFFFFNALAANLIPTQRASNQIDIGYLFYLPFCQIFVSSDKLHRDCAPLFLRNDQEFVWGGELKDGLRELNLYYDKLPEQIKEQGILGFAVEPPKDGHFFVAGLWDRHVPKWREKMQFSPEDRKLIEAAVFEKMKVISDARPAANVVVDSGNNEPEFLVKRLAKHQKGSWWQMPKNLKFPKSN
jgi:hypothetical protein